MPPPFDASRQVRLIYDEYRNVLLNKYYYGIHLVRYRKFNGLMEFFIAIGATGSGVAGLAVWQTDYGRLAWAILSAVSIVLAVVKPLCKFGEKIENYGKIYGGYATAHNSLHSLVDEIQIRQAILEEHMSSFSNIRSRTAELIPLEDPTPNREIVRHLQQQVISEINIDNLWTPPSTPASEAAVAAWRGLRASVRSSSIALLPFGPHYRLASE
jgi:hypothetical protein